MLNLLQITDCHLFADPKRKGLGEVCPADTLSQVLYQVVAHAPDLLICTGDISGDDSLKSYQLFLHLLEDAGVDCDLRVIPGNHDKSALMQQVFGKQLMSGHVYESGSWVLHGLDSQYQGTIGQVDEQQLSALQLAISSQPQKHHLVAVHHHPIPVEGWMDKHEWLNRQTFVDQISQFEQVKGVIYGHVHFAREHHVNNCFYWGCPSTCWQFADSKEFALAPEAPGFRQLKLHDDGHISTDIFRIS